MLNEIRADGNLWFQCATWNNFETDANWHHLRADVQKWNRTSLQRCQRRSSHPKTIKVCLAPACQLQRCLYSAKWVRCFSKLIQWDKGARFQQDWKSVAFTSFSSPGYALCYQPALALDGSSQSGVAHCRRHFAGEQSTVRTQTNAVARSLGTNHALWKVTHWHPCCAEYLLQTEAYRG